MCSRRMALVGVCVNARSSPLTFAKSVPMFITISPFGSLESATLTASLSRPTITSSSSRRARASRSICGSWGWVLRCPCLSHERSDGLVLGRGLHAVQSVHVRSPAPSECHEGLRPPGLLLHRSLPCPCRAYSRAVSRPRLGVGSRRWCEFEAFLVLCLESGSGCARETDAGRLSLDPRRVRGFPPDTRRAVPGSAALRSNLRDARRLVLGFSPRPGFPFPDTRRVFLPARRRCDRISPALGASPSHLAASGGSLPDTRRVCRPARRRVHGTCCDAGYTGLRFGFLQHRRAAGPFTRLGRDRQPLGPPAYTGRPLV